MTSFYINIINKNLIEILFSLILIISIILVVAYFTLTERKILASIQFRNGPDKTGFLGMFQPIADALKLLFKDFIIPQNVNPILFILSPMLTLFLSIICWLFIPISSLSYLIFSEFSFLWILAISSINVYSIFISGFSSKSKYAMVGSIRAIIQMISYELVMSMVLMPVILISSSFNLITIVNTQIIMGVSNFSFMLPCAFLMFVCILTETNRAPFDLPEAEAELVAGYNVEYSSIPFAFFFLGEYLNILLMSFFFTILFLSGWGFFSNYIWLESLSTIIKSLIVASSIVWVRATLPRVRYDFLMYFCWKSGLFFSTAFLIFYISIYNILISFIIN